VYSGEVWNFHAWAEVYLGESGGWVPVDPTYNEVGFVDSTHISLATVHGARDLSSFKKLSWQGDRGVIGGFGEESLGVEITGSSPQQLVSVSVGAPGRMDGGEMANVTATITNQANSLAVATCSLAMPEEMWLLDSREKSALIGPGGSAQLSWAIASPRSLDKKFLHRMPIDISCFPGANRTVTVVIDPKAEKPPVPRASLTDLTVINASTVSVRFMNSGTQVLDGLVVELCVRDGERYCMNKSSAALGPGAAGQVDYALSISDGDTVEVAFFSEDFKSLYEEAVSIKPEPPAPQPSGFVGNPERALEEAGEPMMLIIVLVVLILIILSAIAAAVRRR
jgi:hypothetical protein